MKLLEGRFECRSMLWPGGGQVDHCGASNQVTERRQKPHRVNLRRSGVSENRNKQMQCDHGDIPKQFCINGPQKNQFPCDVLYAYMVVPQ